MHDGAELAVKVRLGEPELVKEAASRALGLRVFRDRRAALTYTSDFAPARWSASSPSRSSWRALAEPDELNELPPRDELATAQPDLELWDDAALSVDAKERARALQAGEAAARGVLAQGHQLRRRDLLARRRRQRVRHLGRLRRRLSRHLPVARGRADLRRRRRQEAQRLLLDRPIASSSRSAGSRGGRARGGAAHGRQARRREDRRPASCRWSSIPRRAAALLRAARRRHLGRRDLAQVELPPRPRGHAGRLAAGDDRRRSADRRAAPARAPTTARGCRRARTSSSTAACSKTYLFDVYSARKLGRQSNGCAGARRRRRAARTTLELHPADGRDHAARRSSSASSAAST